MAKLTLYGFDKSPPVRAVKLTLSALGLPYEYVQISLVGGDQLKPEFVKKNPQHTVPMLEDGEATIWDSHAIICYLVRKYGKDDTLYPKDFVKRAVVDQRLHFESDVMFAGVLRNIAKPIIINGAKVIPKERIKSIVEVYSLVEAFLKDNDYIAGDSLTVADFSVIPTITALEFFKQIDSTKYVKLSAWIKRMEQLPYYSDNSKGAAELIDYYKALNLTVEELD